MEIESTFMVGDAIKVSPVLEKKNDETRFKAWFPKGDWLNMNDLKTLTVKESSMVDLPFPEDNVHAHLRPGYIVPVQSEIDNLEAAADLANIDYHLIVHRNEAGKASGKIYMDDNTNNLESETEEYTLNL